VKTLHLLRHAKAVPADESGDDHARPLARRGEKAAAALAAHLAATGFAVDRVYCSTAARARATLAPLRGPLAGTPVAFRDALYTFDAQPLLDVIAALPDSVDSVLMVGHNPAFHDAARHLAGRAAPGQGEALRVLREKFPTGALCSLACDIAGWRALTPRCGTLIGFLRPKDLTAG
jgi:phosphohistidine phosphatase